MSHYTREDWGARPPSDPLVLLTPDRVKGVALHWPAMSQKVSGPENVFHLLRNIQTYHMDTHGWSDIAYQLAVDQNGNTYQLRGTRYRSAANGDREVNEEWGAFLLILATQEQPTNALVSKVNRRLTLFRARFPKAQRNAVGHVDVRPEPTACPGPIIEYMVKAGTFRG